MVMKDSAYERLMKKTFIQRGWFKLGPQSDNWIEVTIKEGKVELYSPGGRLLIYPDTSNVFRVAIERR